MELPLAGAHYISLYLDQSLHFFVLSKLVSEIHFCMYTWMHGLKCPVPDTHFDM